jgi:hypothetical protein
VGLEYEEKKKRKKRVGNEKMRGEATMMIAPKKTK